MPFVKGSPLATATVVALAISIFLAALIYSAVGQAGASGYLAVMALFGVAPEFMRPTALALNILVATIGSIKFYRAGFLSWSIFWPFALTSIPFSFIGGNLSLPGHAYKLIVGLVLLFAAFRIFWTRAAIQAETGHRVIVFPVALALGAGIGILSGLVGVGGGIFLSPLLIALGWADMKRAASVSAAFILVNSIAGLSGQVAGLAHLSGAIPIGPSLRGSAGGSGQNTAAADWVARHCGACWP